MITMQERLRDLFIEFAAKHDITLVAADFKWADGWTIDGMPAPEWLDAMLEDEKQ